MAQICVDGRVISEIELKTSARNNPYVRFEITEHSGNKETQKAKYFHVCAFAEQALSLVKAGVSKGSIIQIYGTLEAETYGKSDGKSVGKRMKIMLKEWGLIPIRTSRDPKTSREKTSPKTAAMTEAAEIDGEENPMPG